VCVSPGCAGRILAGVWVGVGVGVGVGLRLLAFVLFCVCARVHSIPALCCLCVCARASLCALDHTLRSRWR